LEDRKVKHAFKLLESENKVQILTKKPLIPTEIEKEDNSRSRSAKLRAAERKNDG
jgi:16S rRNA (cytosine1402-N4)-methyltransferase